MCVLHVCVYVCVWQSLSGSEIVVYNSIQGMWRGTTSTWYVKMHHDITELL